MTGAVTLAVDSLRAILNGRLQSRRQIGQFDLKHDTIVRIRFRFVNRNRNCKTVDNAGFHRHVINKLNGQFVGVGGGLSISNRKFTVSRNGNFPCTRFSFCLNGCSLQHRECKPGCYDIDLIFHLKIFLVSTRRLRWSCS